ncbi:MAG: flagellar export protein FliJ [Desulfuromonadales bacterium C00003068]|jgi:flagellar FliJ protein|nr:MAG: flagellar export protein FliJ [Desulfuromonadales bacterium C00003068]
MKSFKLQVVLEHRQRLEDQARQALAEAIQYEQGTIRKLSAETAELAEIRCEYEERQVVGIQSYEFMLYENRIEHKRQVLIDLDRQLGLARELVLNARQKLGDASREKKLMEKLKEKKNIEIKKELHRKEMAQIDEVAIMFRKEDDR